ncbi:peptidoglycan-binding protein [Oceaniradius stylonematis]|uniref:peptidoglycan-binding protein n=1 Tax=Oceaniradius stylonematis TaxID=2184161 RepID=UPI00273FA5F2|nr:peptidoglycan-binding protein [Oceaniradius stylonematis]
MSTRNSGLRVTLADLQAVAGTRTRSRVAIELVDAINKYASAYDITKREHMALFLAHASIETGGFRRLDENMSYSAQRLLEVWPTRFRNLAHAKQYARQPRKLANYVYGGRMGNKGRPDAGWLYRGSGLGQTTGYDNFLIIENETGMPVTSNPDLLREADAGTKAMCILWRKWDMNAFAERGDVRGSRRVWNGGYNHLAEVEAAFRRGMQRSFNGGPAAAPRRDHVLKHGARGEYVEDLQRSLNELGYGPLLIDGVFGDDTEAAVEAFQTDHGLKVDGWAGNRTQDKIGQVKAERAAQPRIERAERRAERVEDALPQVERDVDQKSRPWQWLTGVFGPAAGGGALIFGMEWQTAAVVFGASIAMLLILIVFRRQIIGAVREVRAEVQTP